MEWIKEYFKKSNEIIMGKEKELKLALTCLLANGHILIEDIPGVGKTTMVKFISKILGLELSRIQFTNDLLPSDILGTNIFNTKDQSFTFHKGPIFGQVILADELNRATPKTQSALLQVMEEKRITIDGNTYKLPEPFFVMATQNPRNQIGTNPLPESQLDRFLMKIEMGYPDKDSEVELLLGKQRAELIEELTPVISAEQLIQEQQKASAIKTTEGIAKYIVEILETTRSDNNFRALSPRAGLDLISAAKAWCYIEQRDAVEPEDVQAIAPSILGHRLTSNLNNSVSLEQDISSKLINSINVY